MKKRNTENAFSNCNCKAEGLYVIALILITGSLLCFILVLVFDMPELATVPIKSKPEFSFENIKERLYKKTKIITQPEESSFEK